MLFELETVGGPLGRRLAHRRESVAGFAWDELAREAKEPAASDARIVWTQSAFSEYASAASFAEIASGLLAVGAPIDLSATAGDFVVDEIFHAELSARVAMALGGAVPLEVDLERLVRPPSSTDALVRVAELVVRTSCVGESLTVAVLRASRETARTSVVADVIARIVRDEAEHAELGWTFLDWADDRLSDVDRAHLGRIAGAAVSSFAPLFTRQCAGTGTLGVMSCDAFDAVFAEALIHRVETPLRERGISLRQ
jgi:hypothetical protein